MEINSTYQGAGSLGDSMAQTYKVKQVVEEQPKPLYNSTVKLQSMMDAHLSYDGLVTGKHYEWVRAGSVVAVDADDAPALLEKRIVAQSCCNGSNNAVFQKVD